MLLQVLGALERLAAELTLVRLERHMDANVRGDVVTLDRSSAARVPLAGEVQVVGALAANMAFTDVLLIMIACQRPGSVATNPATTSTQATAR
jgi:hypothetical protein